MKQQLELDMEQRTGSQLERGRQGCVLSPCSRNLRAEYITRSVWVKLKLESRLLEEVSVAADVEVTPP